ncbi:hypothetical protein GUJ93_ZPchr0012g20062 [Zizania palustris]|uniref:C2 domain-containing protein n=1 Tax=Zizania palustris TaxID=103762 RepID=A0A8J6BU02_ZIZPA|nr:hypothetical protein GUJ93_ZPchr0012g20062 [Zizania palustris]
MMTNLKLGVEVVSAHDLLPKEQGTSNPFVEIEFDDQKFRTAIKDRDLNPSGMNSFTSTYLIHPAYKRKTSRHMCTTQTYQHSRLALARFGSQVHSSPRIPA